MCLKEELDNFNTEVQVPKNCTFNLVNVEKLNEMSSEKCYISDKVYNSKDNGEI